MSMRLIGARNIKEIVPEMVDASNIGSHIVSVPGDELYNSNCEPRSSLVPTSVTSKFYSLFFVRCCYETREAERAASGCEALGGLITIYRLIHSCNTVEGKTGFERIHFHSFNAGHSKLQLN